MRTLYLDCFAGISGDMFVGALLDCGLGLEDLRHGLEKLGLGGYRIAAERVNRSGISATKFIVDIEQGHGDNHDDPSRHAVHHHAHRPLSTIKELITSSGLERGVRERSLGIFQRLGEAEAKVHNVEIETVEFHEVGAIDSIVDIVGASIGLELLNIERVRCSALHLGSGTFRCAHGTYPVPGPATSELVRGIPVYSTGIEGELVTPTGAAIVSSIAAEFGPLPEMRIERTGYGAGTRDYSGFPNVLRAHIGVEKAEQSPTEIAVVETNLDDLNPQVLGYLLESLLDEGALDVFYTPVHMKKNRPGVLLTLLCEPADRRRLCALIFRETTTFGVRYRIEQRDVLDRAHVTVVTPYGEIRIKVGRSTEDEAAKGTPEFADCAQAAKQHGVALREVQFAALAAYRAREQK